MPDFDTLRSALRQAPDVIVRRDARPETRRLPVAAGETGHLVFSTQHTTDVASTLARMTIRSGPSGSRRFAEIAAALSAVFVRRSFRAWAAAACGRGELLAWHTAPAAHPRKRCIIGTRDQINEARLVTLEECWPAREEGFLDRRGRAPRHHLEDYSNCALGGRPES